MWMKKVAAVAAQLFLAEIRRPGLISCTDCRRRGKLRAEQEYLQMFVMRAG